MKRTLISSNTFINAAKRVVKKDPHVAEDIKETLDLLTENIFDTRLKTHKLKGKLKGSLACSVGYNLRIVFKIVRYKSSDAILLETLGTHDEVY
ncbi:MAG: type II toxin-antitoxin system mRNA interferase toxin, RelE/StbE family [Dehalococcoidia bacterium]